ncbi:MAG: MFS transporter [Rickettsiaceae bacterium]|nr:MFS transporter [Rickettsiaceae bacterium]
MLVRVSLPFILVLSLIACCIEVDISVPSLPDISDYFAISDGLTQMTVAFNFLGFCLASIIYGPLSDCFGRRIVMVIGNLIMLVGAIGCTISFSIEFLLFARFIQGIGASTSAVVAFAMIADVYKGRVGAKIIGSMNSLITVFMAMAPVAGAFINEMIGWRGNYGIVTIICLISWIMLYFQLPETKKEFATFKVRKISGDYLKLLASPSFIYSSIVPSVFFSGYMAFVACGSFLYMETYKLHIFYYALHQGVIIGVFSIVSMYVGKIHNFIGSMRKNIIYSTILNIFATLMFFISGLFFTENVYLVTCSMILFSTSSAVCYPIVFAKSLEIFPEIKGTASSLVMSMRALICFLVVALTSYLYDGTLFKVSLVILFCCIIIIFSVYRMFKFIPFIDES